MQKRMAISSVNARKTINHTGKTDNILAKLIFNEDMAVISDAYTIGKYLDRCLRKMSSRKTGIGMTYEN